MNILLENRFFFSSLILTTVFYSCTLTNNVSGDVWHPVFVEEFNDDGLPDSSRWKYDTGGHGFGNNELQYYTNARNENIYQTNGILTITARKESYLGSHYTSAKILTKDLFSFKYGKLEVRAKIPPGTGTWPAIWMMPQYNEYGNQSWPDNGEIDIMEHVGYNPGYIHGTVHTAAYNHKINTQKGGYIYVEDATNTFHVYSIEWSENKIDFLVDDHLYFTFENDMQGDYRTWPFNHPFYIIVNLAIGGDWGGVQGVDDNIFPVQLEIDYIKVYQLNKSTR